MEARWQGNRALNTHGRFPMSTILRSLAVGAALVLSATLFSAHSIAQYQPQYRPYTVGSGTTSEATPLPPSQRQLAVVPAPSSTPRQGVLSPGFYDGDMKSWRQQFLITGTDASGVPQGRMIRWKNSGPMGLQTPYPPEPLNAQIGADGLPFVKLPSGSTVTGLHMGGEGGRQLCAVLNHRSTGQGANAGNGLPFADSFCLSLQRPGS